MRRYELTDERWKLIEDLLPQPGGQGQDKGGRRWRDHRQVLNGILWILHTGAQWRELPERYGPWKTVYGRFRRWSDEGLFDRILQRLQLRLDEEGRIDLDLWLIDGSSIRASRSAAGGKGGSRRQSVLLAAPGAQAPPRAAGSGASCTFWLVDEERLCR